MAINTYNPHSFAPQDDVEKRLQKIYSADDKFTTIDPMSVTNPDASIVTVIMGLRPLALISYYDESAIPQLAAINKIDGILREDLTPSSDGQKSCIIYRRGSEELADTCKHLFDSMTTRQLDEGDEAKFALKRILDSCRLYGRIFHYLPDKIEEFHEKAQKMYDAIEK